MTVTVTDGGPCPFWDHRPMLKLTVAFTDGRRSNWASADAGAGEVAGKIYSPYSVGVMGGDGWEPLIERSQRDQGRRKNGSTMFTFTVFCGPLNQSAHIEEITRGLPLADQLKAIEQDFAARAREHFTDPRTRVA
jgi:hypothetical protein